MLRNILLKKRLHETRPPLPAWRGDERKSFMEREMLVEKRGKCELVLDTRKHFCLRRIRQVSVVCCCGGGGGGEQFDREKYRVYLFV